VELVWVDGVSDLRCAVCGRTHAQELLARATVDWRDEPVAIARCGDCNAVILEAVLPPSSYDDSDWDWYVEHIAGLDAIAHTLAQIGAPAGARMLDVGCGYGFALDLARFLHGWQGIGLDPSIAAKRGSEELGLDIRPGTIDDALAPDERFDVILASEVLEHTADPRDFLAALERLLAPEGVVVLTTPDAELVHPENSAVTLFQVLSVGAHEFLIDRDGLTQLLEGAGLAAKVWKAGGTLKAVASHSPSTLRRVDEDPFVDLMDVVGYCETRGRAAPADSALALGMASRALKWTVSLAAFHHTADGLPRLREVLVARYGIDLDDPGAVDPSSELPLVLIVVFYYFGLYQLAHKRAARTAAAYFSAAAAIAKAKYESSNGYRDLETPELDVRARGNLAFAMARFDPDGVPAVLDSLDEAVRRGADHLGVAPELRARAEAELLHQRSAVRRLRRKVRTVTGTVRRRLSQPREYW
jgi:SAM-dependent methyltransferase